MLLAIRSRTARGAPGLSIRDLSARGTVGVTTITRFESGQTEPARATLAALLAALEAGDVEFIPDNGGSVGVRMRKPAEKRDPALG